MISRMVIVLLALGLFSSTVFSQISSTTPSSRCGEGVLVLHATASAGTITWYEVPFYGTAITEGVSSDGTSLTTPWLEVTKTYYVDALDGEGCSLNPGNARVSVIATISANSIQAIIFYSSNTFCKSLEGEQEVTRTGTAGGVFTVDPSGLTLDPETGSITPSTSTEGTYTVTYTVVPAEGCIENPALTSVTITTAPVQPVISYAGSPYCTTHDPVTVVQTGATGGTYSASPSGLTIHPSSGTITPATSTTGNYTITYFVPGAGGCAPMAATAEISILQLPTASISYNSPFTKNQGPQSVTLTGTGVYTGGVYTSTAGLTIDPSTGTITPASSTAGDYTVTYTLSAVSPCSVVATTTEITIYALPSAVISGDDDVCKNSAPAPEITFTGADGTAPYTFTYKVNGGFDQTVTTTSGNSVTVEQPTITTGTFEYSLVSVMDALGSTQDQTGTATITVNTPLVALFSYPGSPYCSNDADPMPTFLDDGIAGIFSSTTGLVFVSTATGQIDLSASTAGTYTVTNTIAATMGCPEVVATADITITRLPVTAFSYPASPYCATAGTATPTINDAGIFSANDPFVVFLDSPPGTVNVAATPPGTYEITNTIIAADGCAEVHDHASITIESTPAMTISHNYSICNATSTNIELASTPEATSYSWTIGTITGSITGASSGTSTTIIDQVLFNPSNSASGTVEYIVVPTRGTGDCSVGNSFYITVTVKPTPQLSSTLSPAAICSGATFAYTATSAATGATFAWTRATVEGISEPGTTGTGDVSEILTNTTSAPIDVTYAYITTADECSNSVQNVVVSVVPDANITTQPLSPPSICVGGTTENMTIAAADGTPSLTYQWQYYDEEVWEDAENGSPAGSEYTGSQSVSFSVSGISAAGVYDYRCIVSASGNGCGDATSNTVNVTVTPDPSWTNYSNPSPTSLCAGGTVAFSVEVENGLGGDITWIRSDNATPGAGTEVTVTTGDLPGVGTWYYRPHFEPDGSGCNLADGTQTMVTVSADPSWTNYSNPSPTALCLGGTVAFSVEVADGLGGDITWIRSDNATPGAGTEVTVTSGDAPGVGTWYYRPHFEPAGSGCNLADGTQTTVTVSADPSWTNYSNPTPTELCLGGTVAFSVEVENGLDGDITWIRSDNAISGEGTEVTVTTGDAPGVGTWYYRPHFEPEGPACNLADGTQTMVTVSADPSWTNYSNPSPTTLCPGGTVAFSVEVADGLGGDITWIRSDNTIPGLGTEVTVITGDAPGVGTWYYRPHFEPSGSGCNLADGTQTTVTVSADPSWTNYSNPAPTALCLGGTVAFSVEVANGLGGDITWIRSDNAIPGAGTEVTVTTGDAPGVGTWYYRPHFEPAGSGCNLADGAQTTVTVSTDPSWTNYSNPSPTALCLGGTVAFSVEVADGLGGDITWIRSDNATPGLGTEVTVTSGDAPGAGTWYYRPHFEPDGSGCNLADGTQTTVTVYADPSWTNYSNPSPTALCLGGTVAFSVDVADGLGGDITWIRSDNSTPGLGTEVTVTTGDAPGAGTWYYRPHFEPDGSGCNLADGTQTTVTVAPITVAGSVTGGTTICSGSTSAELTLGGYTGTITKWQYSVSPFETWTDIVNSNPVYTSGALTVTTQFRAAVKSGECDEEYSAATTVTVETIPATPGDIIGNTSQCESTTGHAYSISAVTFADSYTWGVPTGWSITAGQGTTDITVTAGTSVQDGDITVTASSQCGTSLPSTLAVISNELPTATISGSTSICTGGSADLIVTFTGAPEWGFTWTDGTAGGDVSGITTPAYTLTVSPTENETYTITEVTDGNGCTNTGTGSAKVFFGPVTEAADISACPGSLVEIPVTVSSFQEVGSINLTLNYTKAVMTFNSYTDNSGLIDDCVADESGSTGIITISGRPAEPGELADDAVLLTLKFNYISGQTDLTWDDDPATLCQYSTILEDESEIVFCDTPTASYYINGSVTGNSVPSAPAQGTHTPSATEIIWNWNTVSGASGYKWNTTNDYASATDMLTAVSNTETGLSCGSAETSYVWAYNASGCVSAATTLSQTTSTCTHTGGLTYLRGNNGSQYDFVVTGTTTGSVWGCGAPNYYTDDSALETVAVHAGYVSDGQTKTVRVEILPGYSSYSGCTQNGVTSSGYGAYPGSYRIISSW